VTARILDGRETSAAVKSDVSARVAALKARGIAPGLGTLLVGDDPASASYVAGKHRDCAEVGIASVKIELPADATEAQVVDAIEQLNADPTVTAYIVQLPLPAHIDSTAMLSRIDPAKDADALHPLNLGRLVLDVADLAHSPLPCTPSGILQMLEHYGIPVHGREITVVGRGLNVGRPLSLLLTRRGFEDVGVTLAHPEAGDLEGKVRAADIVVVGVGRPGLIPAGWIKPGAVVVDVGVNRVGTTASGKAKLVGDVDPDAAEVASWISPVPGGVGLMTRAMLLRNVVLAAERAAR
jgi:methylenetetrahydrofolate dehydrogenase (NADP+) / methenyltetrahydrofolate cyclohydrolase